MKDKNPTKTLVLLRAKQSDAVMPKIGGLLDAWELLPNDTKDAIRVDAPALAEALDGITEAVEAA